MATAMPQESICSLVEHRTLELQTEAGRVPDYNGVVVTEDTLLVIDDNEWNFQVYRRRDGKLISTHRLESHPRDVRLISKTEVAVWLWDSTIVILSLKSIDDVKQVKTLDVRTGFYLCDSVAKWNSDKLVVSGWKWDDMLYWCVVNLTDGRVDSTHKVCKGDFGSYSHLAVNNNTVYITCRTGGYTTQGVYAYDIFHPHTPKFLYQHLGFEPYKIMVDVRNFIYVCYRNSNRIHQLTDSGHLVTIHTVSSRPYGIFYDDQHGVLYTTRIKSDVITVYRLEYSHQSDTATIPAEILRMNNQSIQLFKEAIRDGEAKVYNIRVMVVGHLGVGKTTLIKRFLEKEVYINERQSTEGIIVHVHCCKVSHDGLKWTLNEGDSEQNVRLQRLAQVLNDQVQKKKSTDKRVEQVEIIYQREGKGRVIEIIYKREKKNRAGDHAFHLQPVSQDIQSSSEPDKLPSNQSNEQGVNEMESTADKISDDPAMEILKLLHDKADTLKQGTDVPLTMVDFAGHFAFYTTHQTFLTHRAIYLLVSDISKHVTDTVTDDCYFDMEGIKLCKVYELVEVWLNSIHSCTPSPGAKNPPVILVGTHTDQIQQDSREAVCHSYFQQIRYEYIGTKPTIVHLADEDFAIDNTVIDQKLDDLKKKIIQLASEQPYWGEAIPVRWLTLEEHLMNLKAAGVKVIPYSLLEKMNQKEAVKIESREELDLFLKFQHDVGNILYFGTEDLKEQITLDPQWLIYSLRTIITAENFILQKIKSPTIIQKWREFKKTGKLTQELIDAIWTKENNPDCHGNKDLILGLMEQLNIIARPLSFSKDGDQVKEASYFLAPCMLQQETPEEVICPKPNQQIESSPVMCYVFTSTFLPSPIFHRLVAACVAHWPVAKKKKEQTEENLIFCGCCVFQLDQQHKVTLYFREHVIFLRVTRMGIMDKTPSSKLCIEVRELITTNLLKIIGYLGQSLKFEYYIQCPEYSGVSINSLIPVSLLKENPEVHCDFHDHMIESCKVLDFWFEDQEQSGDSDASSGNPMPPPPTGDTDRFMRIAYLLVDVGSRVLRRLLSHHTVTSTCTLDQYLVKNMNTINSVRRVFNPTMMDIMFPPTGDDTNLNDYDITLLSALFNIVPSLSKQEKDMIQKLREDRNKLYGHAKSCQINAIDYQTYWNDISSTLVTLSQQCRDAAFEVDILQEIQRTQISAISAGSCLDILKSWFDRIEAVEDELQNVTSILQALVSKEKSFENKS